MTEKQPCIIFSVFQNEKDDNSNRFATEAVETHLKMLDIGHKIVVGCYKGKCELSFVVEDTIAIRRIVLDLATRYNQESVLFLNNERFASLHYLNIDSSQFIGRFVQATKNATLQEDAWTFDPEHEQFYIVV